MRPAPRSVTRLCWGTVTEHAHQHLSPPATSDAAESRACCGDSPEAAQRQARARRLVVLSGVCALAVVAIGLIVGGWLGASLVGGVAVGIAVTAAGSWSRLSLNDRLLRVAVVLLLIALALVRAVPR